MLSSSMSDARIAKALPINVDGQMVHRWCQKNGIEKGKAKYASVLDPFTDEIKRMYVDEGITDQLIADTLPVTVTADTCGTTR